MRVSITEVQRVFLENTTEKTPLTEIRKAVFDHKEMSNAGFYKLVNRLVELKLIRKRRVEGRESVATITALGKKALG